MLPLPIAVQEKHQGNTQDSKANSLEIKIYGVEKSLQILQIELHKITEKMETLTEPMNKLEKELSSKTVPAHRRRK